MKLAALNNGYDANNVSCRSKKLWYIIHHYFQLFFIVFHQSGHPQGIVQRRLLKNFVIKKYAHFKIVIKLLTS